ncbi:MAG: MFS transporter [Alphaproteobacteria bacterium]|nr:MFS transporter [Alphaproteobacteria bacterium]
MAAGGSAEPKSVSSSPPLSLGTKLAYGIGAIAYGIKDGGFSYFLLLFYSQVVGINAQLVGLAISIALVFDAFGDPLIGYLSDNLHSRWGRRHPFMYAAALPVAVAYYFLWAPPVGWSHEALFIYLLVLSILIRFFITLFETPSAALTPELTADYDQRSSLISYRTYFGWTGGNAMSVMMFMALFPAFVTEAIPNGQFNRDAYATYGLIAAGLMFVAIMISSLGTHSRIPHLKAPPAKRRITIVTALKEILGPLANRSFVALFVATIFGSIGAGLSAALAFYLLTYFWSFTSQQIGIITLGVFLSAVIGALLAPIVTRTLGKKNGAMIVGVVAFLGSPLPVALRLWGVLPDGPTPFVFWFVFISGVIDVGLIICFQILGASMMADLVEQSELRTGRRAEGTFVAVNTFVRKLVNGLGVLTATYLLTLAHFPAGAAPSQVPPEAIRLLGAYYVPTIVGLWMTMMLAISAYTLTRDEHEENLRKLAERNNRSD